MVRVRRGLAVAMVAGAVVVAGASVASADAGAQGLTAGSPGVLSGNLIQVPIHIPVNACGNTVSIIGLLNPSFGNTCINA
ncbi:chaplin family protein [Streptomyces sp. NPDC008265]|uniref:chaplin n=1 Tax=Streptomyces sp. NPDC008265 TaxID=3364824 RepID=UPI0036E86B4C